MGGGGGEGCGFYVNVFLCRCLYLPYVNCFGRTMLYMCIEYCTLVNMYHVSALDVDERMIDVHYYCCCCFVVVVIIIIIN